MKRTLGPTQDVSLLKEKYEPVSCDFTDHLEHLSVLKVPVQVSYFDTSDIMAKHTGLITNIYTSDQKEEFLQIDEKILVRLDRIIEIKEP